MEEETVSAAEANRNFSRVLREVREGRAQYVVTVHGRPVAKIVPINEREAARAKAREALFERLRSQPVIDIGPWTRDELYDETE
jgi:prevent-host-death family protein